MDGADLPLGFTMALAQHAAARRAFDRMSEEEQREILERTHGVRSRAEMMSLVNGLSDRPEVPGKME